MSHGNPTQRVEPAAGFRNPLAPLAAGTRIGRFRILAMLGAGGMGAVYLAEQLEPVQRRVAIKLLRERSRDPLAIARFEVERQALAQMQHPAIAQVFDAGTTEDGHPWLAMEYIDGRVLSEFARAERLGQRQLLRLFLRICQGVQHAHQKGLIHRDLKPSNVLVSRVDGVPLPKIIDFGIAVAGTKDESGTARAQVSDQSGTYAYMSPEQLRGDRLLDTRVDIYALGVILAELLTGQDAPQLGYSTERYLTDFVATLADAPLQPSVAAPTAAISLRDLVRQVPAELRWVLLRALDTERDRRYPSVTALAEDVERYLQRRPLLAVPPSRRYLLGKFVQRHRLSVAAAGVALAALLGGAALALHGLVSAQRARDVAETAAERARVEAAKAQAISAFVGHIFAGIDPDQAKAQDTRLLRTLLDTATQRADADLATQPAVAAGTLAVLSDAYAGLGDGTRAIALRRTALAAAEQAGESATVRVRHRIELAALEAEEGDVEGRIAEARAALATLPGSIATDEPARIEMQFLIAEMACAAAHYADCHAQLEQVLAAYALTLDANDPRRVRAESQLARAAGDLARWDEAEARYRTLIARIEAALGANHSLALDARNGLAVLHLKQRNAGAAEAELRDLLPRYEALFGSEHPETIAVASNYAAALRQFGRNAEARPIYSRVAEAAERTFGPFAPRTVMAKHNLGNLLRDLGELEAAGRLHREAVTAAGTAFGERSPNRSQMHGGLARVLIRQGRFAEAEAELLTAWPLVDGVLPPEHLRVQGLVDAAIELYTAWDKPDRRALWESRRTVR